MRGSLSISRLRRWCGRGSRQSPAEAQGNPKPNRPPPSRPVGAAQNAMLELLKRPGGATSQELQKISGWQPHSVRGFLSGTVGKKMRLTVISAKGEDGERNYSIKA